MENKCGCSCHENKLKKPYAHDKRCCAEINGFIGGEPNKYCLCEAPNFATHYNIITDEKYFHCAKCGRYKDPKDNLGEPKKKLYKDKTANEQYDEIMKEKDIETNPTPKSSTDWEEKFDKHYASETDEYAGKYWRSEMAGELRNFIRTELLKREQTARQEGYKKGFKDGRVQTAKALNALDEISKQLGN